MLAPYVLSYAAVEARRGLMLLRRMPRSLTPAEMRGRRYEADTHTHTHAHTHTHTHTHGSPAGALIPSAAGAAAPCSASWAVAGAAAEGGAKPKRLREAAERWGLPRETGPLAASASSPPMGALSLDDAVLRCRRLRPAVSPRG
jgi:hypothetical protein